jgi:3-mercaptopyruvate sulfurtransferase SseA
MRFLVSLLATTGLLALLVLAGCNSMDKAGGNTNVATTRAANPPATNSTQQQPALPPAITSDGARRVTTAELESALKNGTAIVVDVRNDAAFKQAHIKGARLIPFNEIANHTGELPRDKMIVTYCS